MSYNDDEVLQAVDDAIRRDQRLKNTIVQASQRRDVEFVERILKQILYEMNRKVEDFRTFVHKAIEWFRRSY